MSTLILERGTSTQNWADFVDEWESTVPETASLPIIFVLDGLSAWQRQQSGERPSTGGGPVAYEPTPVDFWFEKCLRLIAGYRSFKDGWDGEGAVAPSQEALGATECLVALFASLPSEFRPQLCLDGLGRPSFAARDSKRYLDLTVDGADRITWYLTKGGEEDFEDCFPFDGASLPKKLVDFFGE